MWVEAFLFRQRDNVPPPVCVRHGRAQTESFESRSPGMLREVVLKEQGNGLIQLLPVLDCILQVAVILKRRRPPELHRPTCPHQQLLGHARKPAQKMVRVRSIGGSVKDAALQEQCPTRVKALLHLVRR